MEKVANIFEDWLKCFKGSLRYTVNSNVAWGRECGKTLQAGKFGIVSIPHLHTRGWERFVCPGGTQGRERGEMKCSLHSVCLEGLTPEWKLEQMLWLYQIKQGYP